MFAHYLFSHATVNNLAPLSASVFREVVFEKDAPIATAHIKMTSIFPVRNKERDCLLSKT